GEELITDLAVETYGLLEIQQASMWNRPVAKFWATLADDEEESVSIQLVGFGGAREDRVADLEQVLAEADAAENARVGAEESSSGSTAIPAVVSPAATADAPAAERRPSRALLPWIVAGVAVALVLILAVLPRLLPVPGDEEESTRAVEARPAEPASPTPGVADGDAAAAAGEGGAPAEPAGEPVRTSPEEPWAEPANPPAADPPIAAVADGDPPTPEVQAEDVVETPAEPTAGQGPPRLNHTPVTRGIRGKDIRFSVGVDPAGSYRSTVWFRGVPGGSWQTRRIDGGEAGTLTVMIPAGVWLDQTSTEVEYFIEVAGPGGLARSGSAVDPYSFRLY
ncbi:MAG: hypothetical protein QGH45_24445, partial [Myxococcota bacterium]|nr:hypothetical protein [Myxococcota bacterium]